MILPRTANERPQGNDAAIEAAQRLRMKRFGLSVATYGVVQLAAALFSFLGLGGMTGAQWALFVGLGLAGVITFFLVFQTHANLRSSEPSLAREQIIFWSFWGMFAMHWMPGVRPIILLFYLPPFSFGLLALSLRQHLAVVFAVMSLYAGLLAIEYFQNPMAFNARYQIFLFVLFGILLVWFAFFGGFVSNLRRSLRAQKAAAARTNDELSDALRKVKTLHGLLPICASCKKIRDGLGGWHPIESYVRDRSDAEFSHGICPDCAKTLFPGAGTPSRQQGD